MRLNTVIEGDCLEVMKGFPDNCIDTIITDPPYSLSSIKKRFAKTSVEDENITGYSAKNGSNQYGRLSKGFMGKEWDNEIAFNPAVWVEALRVAKPGATLLAFGGTQTHHRLMVAIEDAGWEIRDVIMYLFGSGFPKSHDVSKAIDRAKGKEREVVGYSNSEFGNRNGKTDEEGGIFQNTLPKELKNVSITTPSTPLAKQFDGYGTALKPAYEPIIVAMKPVDKNFACNAEKWGVSGLWIDGSRVPMKDGTNSQSQESVPNFKSKIYGKGMGGGEWNQSPKGRFPANIIHDGSEKVEAEFAKADTHSAGHKKGKFGDRTSSGEILKNIGDGPCGARFGDSGTPSRFFYTAKASAAERGKYNNHPTVKPLALLKYLATLTKTPTGGIILDMFGGSGTTALAAIATGRPYILIEKEPEYVQICNARIAEFTGEKIPEVIEVVNEAEVEQLSLW